MRLQRFRLLRDVNLFHSVPCRLLSFLLSAFTQGKSRGEWAGSFSQVPIKISPPQAHWQRLCPGALPSVFLVPQCRFTHL